GGGAAGHVDALVVTSPHFVTGGAFLVNGAYRPRFLQDFEGFPEAWYRVRYEPPGEPRLAKRITLRAREAGLPVQVSEDAWGLDHGAWTPLLYLYPDADVPVVSLSMALYFGRQPAGGEATPSPEAGPEAHRRLGAAVAEAAEDLGLRVAVLATGALTHRLDRMAYARLEAPAEAAPEAPGGAELERARPYDRQLLARLLQHRWEREELEGVDAALRQEAAPEGENRPLHTLLGALAAEEARSGRRFEASLLAYEEAFDAFTLSTLLFRPSA
ncbi:MAG: dioxygenase, partial [Clostridia bacterium]|nr:dioxygenase [Clostridia bacterium]